MAIVTVAVETAFADAMRNAGIEPPSDIVADGRIHRFSTDGDAGGKKSGAYALHNDARPGGWFKNWRTGGITNWTMQAGCGEMSAEEMRRWRKERSERDTARSLAKARAQAEAASQARRIIDRAQGDVGSHPYTKAKGVPFGPLVRMGVWVQRHWPRALLVPLYDAAGRLLSVQAINAEGEKDFLAGGAVAGCFHPFGTIRGAATVLIGEGLATVAACAEAASLPGAAAMSAGNLSAVAKAVRSLAPSAEILILADNDAETEGNPGVREAGRAADSVGGRLLVPDLGGSKCDWWDIFSQRGAEAVRTAILKPAGATEISKLEPAAPMTKDRTLAGDLMQAGRVQLVRGDEVTMAAIRWLWPDWLARGKIHILAGSPGTGKTTIALALGAAVTVGGRLPDGSTAPQGEVLIWSGEDSVSDGLVPKLAAMRADLSRVRFIEGTTDQKGPRQFDPAHDIDHLKRQMQGDNFSPSLLIVDPIVNAVAGDSHKGSEVRRGLAPLVAFAEEAGCAIIGVSHFSKGTQGRDPVERVTASIAFTAQARIVLVVAKRSPEEGGGRLMVRAKSNIGPDTGGFEYDTRVVTLPNNSSIRTTVIAWGAALEGSARELLDRVEETPEGSPPGQSDAVEWLREVLTSGPLPVTEIRTMAREAGMSLSTLRRARNKLGCKTKKAGMQGGWTWALPDHRPVEGAEDAEGAEDVQPESVGTFGTFGSDEHLRDDG